MPKVTLIARLTDGLPLAASMADEKDAYAKELESYERQAKKLVRSLASSYNNNLTNQNDEHVTVESGPYFCFHYVLSSGVCILTLTERAYPKRLAFDYLDELRKEFFQVYGNQVHSASRPYEFIRFDTFIQKTKKVYNDSKTQRNLQKLNSELKDVHSIMTKNINEVISRGEKLENVAQKSTRLAQESKRYAAQAKHANRMRIVRQYAPIGIVIVVVVVTWLVIRRLR
ncbi:unnamed protein product [Agarophyton chilense]